MNLTIELATKSLELKSPDSHSIFPLPLGSASRSHGMWGHGLLFFL